jgi:pimeloyl-ACP methyl ester carboxylesterase
MRGFGETNYEREDGCRRWRMPSRCSSAARLARSILVACSIRGEIAIDLALAYPQRIAALVLIGTAVRGAPLPPVEQAGRAAELSALLEAAEAAGDMDEINRLEAWMWLGGPTSPEGRVNGRPRELFLDMNGRALSRDNLISMWVDRFSPCWRTAEFHVDGQRISKVWCSRVESPGGGRRRGVLVTFGEGRGWTDGTVTSVPVAGCRRWGSAELGLCGGGSGCRRVRRCWMEMVWSSR